MKKNKLFLVDVSSMFFRAFYAIRPLSTPAGVPVNAVYGVISMTLKLLKEHKPEFLVFCYDTKEPSFRKELYSDYKANRTEMPEDLIPQIPLIKKAADCLGIAAIEKPGFEADDIIGSLTEVGRENNFEVFIVSGDKDFGQLIHDGVFMIDTMKDLVLDEKGVFEKWGVQPQQFIDYLALMGDSSDNVPGVRGIGPKGAQKLIEQFGTLEGIYKNIESVKGDSLKQKLIEGKDNAFLSRKLVTIETKMDIDKNIESYRRTGFKESQLKELLVELNFKSMEKSIWDLNMSSGSSSSSPDKANQNQSQKNLTAAEADIDVVKSGSDKIIQTNVESLSCSQMAERFAEGSEIMAFHHPMGIFISGGDQLFQYSDAPEKLMELDIQKKFKWQGFDLKSLWHQLKLKDPQTAFDAMVAAYVLHPGGASDFAKVISYHLQQATPELMSPAEQFDFLQQLKVKTMSQLKQQEMLSVYQELDLPLVRILYSMESLGVQLDGSVLTKQSDSMLKQITHLEKEIQSLAGEPFNVASPKQLSQVLFDKLKLTPGKKTKTGFSTDNEVLTKLQKDHPIIEHLILYRELAKLKSTYLDTLPQMVDAEGRLHSHFNQALTTTGRLSSNEPNLQNIPIRTVEGAKVREAFVASKGNKLLGADYSQIELRVLAHYTGDAGLTRAFADDVDVHAVTASEVFGVKLGDVTSEQRRTAKAINFGIAYGQGAFGLAENLGISRAEAQDIIKKYFIKFSGVKTYIEDMTASVHEKGFVTTLFGRKRFIEEVKSQNVNIRKFGERAAINAPIQGTAADIVKKAMIDLFQQTKSKMILQVHDELIFEGSPAELESEKSVIVSKMQDCAKLNVPLKVNSAVGDNWAELK